MTLRPRRQISPWPSSRLPVALSSGAKSLPLTVSSITAPWQMAVPTVPSLSLAGHAEEVMIAVVSDMPKPSMIGMSSAQKNCSTSLAIGAAPDPKAKQRSRPKVFLTFLKTIALKTKYLRVSTHDWPDVTPPLSMRPRLRARPTALAARAIFFCVGEPAALFAFIASITFSHTRGTPKKKVGRVCCSSGSSPPDSASGVAK